MLSIPLPLIVSALLVVLLYRTVGRSGVPGSKLYFWLFLGLCLLQGLITGLHYGYGVTRLASLQPISAALMPGLAFLAFGTLGEHRVARPWLHLLAAPAFVLIMLMIGWLLDLALILLFAGYAAALWRLAADRDQAFAQARLEGSEGIVHAARLTAALLLFSALSDAALALYFTLYGPGSAPVAIGIVNLLMLAGLICGFLYSVPASPQTPAAAAPDRPTIADSQEAERFADILLRVEQLFDDTRLYADSNLNLSRLARRLNLPSRDVSSAINARTGLNVSQFVNNRRIAEACRLLRQTPAPMLQIMEDSGFSTKSNFNREFRRVTGMSPRDWRSRATGDYPAPAPDGNNLARLDR